MAISVSSLKKSFEQLSLDQAFDPEYEDLHVSFSESPSIKRFQTELTHDEFAKAKGATRRFTRGLEKRTREHYKFTSPSEERDAMRFADMQAREQGRDERKLGQSLAYLRAAVIHLIPDEEFELTEEEKMELDPSQYKAGTDTKIRLAFEKYSSIFLKSHIRKK